MGDLRSQLPPTANVVAGGHRARPHRAPDRRASQAWPVRIRSSPWDDPGRNDCPQRVTMPLPTGLPCRPAHGGRPSVSMQPDATGETVMIAETTESAAAD